MTIPFAQPWLTAEDREAVDEVLRGSVLTHGPRMEEFENGFSTFLGDGVHSVAVSSCMAALHLSYMLLDIGQGDEVIVPAQTHVATAHAVELVGARPVFVDCELQTGNIDLKQIEPAITPRTRAISVVHFLGTPVKMPDVIALARSHGLAVVEDCALALGTRYAGRHAGLFGDVGCFSFYPVKHITCGEGGMFVTRNADLAAKARRFRAFGVNRSAGRPGSYDVDSLGLNYRLSELASALGLSQLRRIDQNLDLRAQHFSALKTRLSGLPYVSVLERNDEASISSHYCLGALLRSPLADSRDAIIAQLRSMGIGSSVYYPHPVPRLEYYRRKYGWEPGRFRNAEEISDHSIALPVGPTITPSDCSSVAEAVTTACTAQVS